MKRTWLVFIGIGLFFVCACSQNNSNEAMNNKSQISNSDYVTSSESENKIHLLFIHHSCGAQLLADKADKPNAQSLYTQHPNGGGLRSLLEENNYVVHQATFGSLIGNETDVCHWNAKFKNHMQKILTCSHQDEFFNNETRNNVIMFKSCYPNNLIKSEGEYPGDPDSCEKTIANYKAAYNSLFKYFQGQPETLFVVLTAPPAARPTAERFEYLIEKGYIEKTDTIDEVGKRARSFNNWLKDKENGWLKGYRLNNVVVFDLYDVLTDYGKSNWSQYPTRGGKDSHPSSEGNTKASMELVTFIKWAFDRLNS